MANKGKFTDKMPEICAAGKANAYDNNDTVASLMHDYPLEDQIHALKNDAGIFKLYEKQPNPVINDTTRNLGAHTEIWPVLRPPVPTEFQTLINDLKETSYDSYWNAPDDGKSRYPIPGLPKGMPYKEITFGRPPTRGESAKELVNPPKGPYEVQWDSQIAHDMYVKTHNDYNPGEQVNRNYCPPFCKGMNFGQQTTYDPRGIWFKCCTHWKNADPVSIASKIQSEYEEKYKDKLGKCLTPNNILEMKPPGYTFGKKSVRECFGVEDLLRDCDPSIFKRDLNDWIAHLNQIRLLLKSRRPDRFNKKHILDRMKYYDQENIGLLPLDLLYQLCNCFNITFNKGFIESLCKYMEILIPGNFIKYEEFMNLLDANEELNILKVDDVPPEKLHFLTTYQAAMCDRLYMDNSGWPAAGEPSFRFNLAVPLVPPGRCRANLDDLGEYTTTGDVVRPSIYTQYGLTYRDFLNPRNELFIRNIFSKIGYNLPDEIFCPLWSEAVKIENLPSKDVSIDTFYKLLQKRYPKPQLKIDEVEC